LNPANQIKAAAAKEGLAYWDFCKKYQKNLNLPRVFRVEMKKVVEERDRIKAEKQAEKRKGQ